MSCTVNFRGQQMTETEMNEIISNESKAALEGIDSSSGSFVQSGLKKEINNLETVHEQIITRIFNAHKLSQMGSKVELAARKEKDTYKALEELKESLEDLNVVDEKKTVFKFVDWANGVLHGIQGKLDKMIDSEFDVYADDVVNIRNMNAMFDLLEDVLVIKDKLGDQLPENFNDHLNELNALRQDNNAKIIKAERVLYARMMSKNSTKHLTQWREHFNKQYDVIQPQEEKSVWIEAMMAENAEDIKDSAYQDYLKRAEESIGDISAASAWIVSEKNISSAEIQVVSKMIDNADLITDKFSKDKAAELKSHLDEFTKDKQSLNRDKLYEKFVEQTDEGSYLLSEFSVDFLKEREKVISDNTNPEKLQEMYSDVKINTKSWTTKVGSTTFAIRKLIHPKGTNFKLEGDFITFEVNGETYRKHKTEAIGTIMINKWKKENQKKISTPEGFRTIPIDKWKNQAYSALSDQDKKSLNEFKDYISQADEITGGVQSLIERGASQKWFRLPGVRKSSMARLYSGDGKGLVLDKIGDMYKRRADELEVGGEGSSGNTVKVLADLNNKEKFSIPAGHRAKLSKKDQSLDLHTLLFMNLERAKNFEQKKRLENQIMVFVDIMGNRYVPKKRGLDKKQEMHSFSSIMEMKVFQSKSDLPNDAKKILSMAENRIYGIKSKDAGKVAGMNVQKATNTVLKYAGKVSLIGNFANSIVNATTGTMNNIIEAIGGESYNLRDWKTAGVKYTKDLKGIMDDMGRNVHMSRTNLFNDIFNTQGTRKALNSNFENSTWARAASSGSILRPLANAGEHMMQSKVMYAVMNNIKVQNSKGQLLDKNGKVVNSKKQAASIDEVISFNTSKGGVKAVIPNWVKGTTFSPSSSHQTILLETRNLIKKKIIDLHGNYDSELQSAAQREWWGKTLFFLKKWMVSTTLRRWRGAATMLKNSEELSEADRFYSEDLKSNQEGYYVTAVRFMRHGVFDAMKSFNLALIKSNFNDMTTHEKANVRRFLMEMSVIALLAIAYGAMDDEDDETLYMRYLMRREIAELTFYSNPSEVVKILKNPSAAINFSERVTRVMGQALSPTEEYTTGVNKGKNKLWVKTLKALPGTAQYKKDYEASLRFLEIME